MKAVLAVLAACVLVVSESKVLVMRDYQKMLSRMFAESCAQYIPNHGGIGRLKAEIDECYDKRKLPDPRKLDLTGIPIGLEDDFKDKYIFASSYRKSESKPQNGRLNAKKKDGHGGAWCAKYNNEMQFFQVDLGAISNITGIITQGENGGISWVGSYTIEISNDGSHWSCLFGSDGRVLVFTGNKDSDSPVTNVLNPPRLARHIRIIPKSWTTHICLRAEIYVNKKVPREEDKPEPIPDFETEILAVDPKRPKALVVKSHDGNQVNVGAIPQQYTDRKQAPLKSISFGHSKNQPELFQVRPELDAQELRVIPGKTLVVRDGNGNMINKGMLPEEYTDRQQVPIKSIGFETGNIKPDLIPVDQGGVKGSPLQPEIGGPLVVAGGGPIDVTVHRGTRNMPMEVGAVDPAKIVGPGLRFEWYPSQYYAGMYLEIATGFPTYFYGISTRGHADKLQWVKAYALEYVDAYSNQWVEFRDEKATDRRIKANVDNVASMDHMYTPAFYTSRLRIRILEWEIRPSMRLHLSLGNELRNGVHIITSPVFKLKGGHGLAWGWEARYAKEGSVHEILFTRAIGLSEFNLELASSITGYKLQYLVGEGQWRYYVDGENEKFSKGEAVSFEGLETKGLRIVVTSWDKGDGEEKSSKFYGRFTLKTLEAVDKTIVRDILEHSNYYLYRKFEGESLSKGSALLFELGKLQRLSEIETRGIGGAWVSKYKLECREHHDKQGIIKDLTGNTNDKDVVEHQLEGIQCKYVLITPIEYHERIAIKVYLFSEKKISGTKAHTIQPGSFHGSASGELKIPSGAGSRVIKVTFTNTITPTKITFGGKAPGAFTLEISNDAGDKPKYEAIKGPNGQIRVFDNEKTTEFDPNIELKVLRIVPKLADGKDELSFNYKLEYTAEKKIGQKAIVEGK